MAAPRTLAELWTASATEHAAHTAQEWHDGTGWRRRSYAELAKAVDDVANALLSCGLKPGDRVAIWSRNAPRWAEVDLACVASGLVTVPIYDTLTAEKAAYIANDAGCRVLFVQGAILPRALDALPRLAMVERVVVLDGDGGQGAQGYEAFVRSGQAWGASHPEALAAARSRVQPDDLASLVYTSGTTAEPKGAMLTQGNFASNTEAMTLVRIGPEDSFLSFLPLSHVFERLGGHFGAYRFGAKVVFARGIETIMDDLAHARPTLMMAVPRLYEKMYARIQENVAAGSAVKRALFAWAVAQGREANPYRIAGKPIPAGLARRLWFADHLVLHKIRDRVGGRLRFFVSGGAALSKDIESFFWACGVSILQGYGLTETSPVCAVNVPGQLRFGSVGKCIPGVQCRIDTSEWTPAREPAPGQGAEGEICFKGPNIMRGYWRNDKATREVFDRDGWFHTGDIGYVDADGYLWITDRKKEIIVMSNGKKVPPQPIENALKLQPHIAQACLIGDGRNYISALVVPDWEAVEKFALQNGIAGDRAALAQDSRVLSLIDQEVGAVNQGLSRYEQVKRFHVIPADWTVESGELTPSLKLKRRVVGERFRDAIKGLYEGEEEAAPVPKASKGGR